MSIFDERWAISSSGYIYAATCADHGDLVCEPPQGHNPGSTAHWPARSRLIVAAPDLVAALRGAIGALEFSRDYHRDLGQDRLCAAYAALAKAGALS